MHTESSSRIEKPSRKASGGSTNSIHSAARALGWIGIGVGVAEIMFPRSIAKLMGVDRDESVGILRACGVREILQSICILNRDNPSQGVWLRVAGDVIDGALLGLAAANTTNPTGVMTTITAVTPLVIADAVVALKLDAKD